MKTNNYSTTDTTILSEASKNLTEAFDKQLMDLLQTEVARMKAVKISAKQLAA